MPIIELQWHSCRRDAGSFSAASDLLFNGITHATEDRIASKARRVSSLAPALATVSRHRCLSSVLFVNGECLAAAGMFGVPYSLRSSAPGGSTFEVNFLAPRPGTATQAAMIAFRLFAMACWHHFRLVKTRLPDVYVSLHTISSC